MILKSNKYKMLRVTTTSPNQVLTHAARAAVTQLNSFSHSVAARGAREGPWSGQTTTVHLTRCLHTLRARLQSSFSATSGGRARRARRALVRATTTARPAMRGAWPGWGKQKLLTCCAHVMVPWFLLRAKRALEKGTITCAHHVPGCKQRSFSSKSFNLIWLITRSDVVKPVHLTSRCTKRQVMRVEKFYVAKPHILYIVKKI